VPWLPLRLLRPRNQLRNPRVNPTQNLTPKNPILNLSHPLLLALVALARTPVPDLEVDQKLDPAVVLAILDLDLDLAVVLAPPELVRVLPAVEVVLALVQDPEVALVPEVVQAPEVVLGQEAAPALALALALAPAPAPALVLEVVLAAGLDQEAALALVADLAPEVALAAPEVALAALEVALAVLEVVLVLVPGQDQEAALALVLDREVGLVPAQDLNQVNSVRSVLYAVYLT